MSCPELVSLQFIQALVVKSFQIPSVSITCKPIFMSSKVISSLVPPSLSNHRMFFYLNNARRLNIMASKVIPTMSLHVLYYYSIHPPGPDGNFTSCIYSFSYSETNKWPDISPVKMGLFRISRELQFGFCSCGEPSASPHVAREGAAFIVGKGRWEDYN